MQVITNIEDFWEQTHELDVLIFIPRIFLLVLKCFMRQLSLPKAFVSLSVYFQYPRDIVHYCLDSHINSRANEASNGSRSKEMIGFTQFSMVTRKSYNVILALLPSQFIQIPIFFPTVENILRYLLYLRKYIYLKYILYYLGFFLLVYHNYK